MRNKVTQAWSRDMVSYRKIAELARVSHVTVYRALHNAERIAPATRDHILAIAAELSGVEPVSGFGVGQPMPALACIAPSTSPFSRFLLATFKEALVHGMPITFFETPASDADIAPLLHALVARKVRAVFLFTHHLYTLERAMINELLSYEIIPILCGGARSERPLDVIVIGEDALVTLALDYLRHLGHHRIAYVGPQTYERSQSVIRLCQHRALASEHAWTPVTFHWFDWPKNIDPTFMRTLFAQPSPPTAIFAFNDYYATRLMQQTHQLGMTIPGDVSIIGCGNIEFSEFLYPPLTTIDHDLETTARLAMEILMQRLVEGDHEPKSPPISLSEPANLVIRESCAPCR